MRFADEWNKFKLFTLNGVLLVNLRTVMKYLIFRIFYWSNINIIIITLTHSFSCVLYKNSHESPFVLSALMVMKAVPFSHYFASCDKN